MDSTFPQSVDMKQSVRTDTMASLNCAKCRCDRRFWGKEACRRKSMGMNGCGTRSERGSALPRFFANQTCEQLFYLGYLATRALMDKRTLETDEPKEGRDTDPMSVSPSHASDDQFALALSAMNFATHTRFERINENGELFLSIIEIESQRQSKSDFWSSFFLVVAVNRCPLFFLVSMGEST